MTIRSKPIFAKFGTMIVSILGKVIVNIAALDWLPHSHFPPTFLNSYYATNLLEIL